MVCVQGVWTFRIISMAYHSHAGSHSSCGGYASGTGSTGNHGGDVWKGISTGIFRTVSGSCNVRDKGSVILSLGIALLLIFFIGDPFKGLLISQMILSIQLPFTVFLQVGLTSSRKVMGQYVNSKWSTFVLYAIAAVVTVLNIMLLVSELTS